jgi:hypothetical protein
VKKPSLHNIESIQEKRQLMTTKFLEYRLNDGYIQNWLVAGPYTQDIDGYLNQNRLDEAQKIEIVRKFHDQKAELAEMPVDRAKGSVNSVEVTWNYFRCHQDHFIDLTQFYPTWKYACGWAYTRLSVPEPVALQFLLVTRGPAEVWVNGSSICKAESFSGSLTRHEFQADLKDENEILVKLETVGVRECPAMFALRVVNSPSIDNDEEITVVVPTQTKYPSRQQALEEALEKAYLEEVVNHRGAHFNLRWAEDAKEEIRYAYQIQDSEERIYVEGTWEIDAENPLDIGHTVRLNERPYRIVLKAPGREYYEMGLRYQRSLPLHVLDLKYSDTPYGTFQTRRAEALKDAAKHEKEVFGVIAMMELERWSEISPKVLEEGIAKINRREAGSEALLVGLLSALCRYGDKAEFPETLKVSIEASALAYRYWRDEPGASGVDDAAESSAILLHAAEILAGQLFSEELFQNTQIKGNAHLLKGEKLAGEWLRNRGSRGFIEWDSNQAFEKDILALATLASRAVDPTVSELSAIVLDKILFTLAVNSFKGAFGGSHGSTAPIMIKSAQLEATSGVSRLLYGMGVFNHHLFGTVGLACSDYEFPTFFADIAKDSAEEIWSKEQQGPDDAHVINKVVYKTPDFMLSSVQNHRVGEREGQAHIWQATMGSEAVVFTNHPACMDQDELHKPGFWLGNAVNPRVAQWKDTLIAIYNLPQDDWMGFTHAYFPIYAFDEYTFEGNWAFARKGAGYLAITTGQGFEQVKRGPDGYRELRAYGQSIWLCQMGREKTDNDFRAFQKKILKTRPEWHDLSVDFHTIRGDVLKLGLTGPFKVNGQEQLLEGFKHMENPYCTAEFPAEKMEISFGGLVMGLDFE